MISEHFDELCRRAEVTPIVDIDIQSIDQLLGLVAGGAAAGLVPISHGLEFPGLAVRPFRPRYPLEYCLGWRRESPLVERLFAALESLDED